LTVLPMGKKELPIPGLHCAGQLCRLVGQLEAETTMVDESVIARAVDLLKAAAPEARIILFGSYARGNARENSDLDFLVVEPEVKSRRREMARLADVLRPLRIAVDILVVSRRTFDEWSDAPGTVICAAAREGKVLYAAA